MIDTVHICREARHRRSPICFWRGSDQDEDLVLNLLPGDVEDEYSESDESVAEVKWRDFVKKGFYDSKILAAMEISNTCGILSGEVKRCRYRHYACGSALIDNRGDAVTPLAMGGHCLILVGDQALVLERKTGGYMLPGGVIDFADIADSSLSVSSAIRREMLEELGFCPEGRFSMSGAFIGGNPDHIFFTSIIDAYSDYIGPALKNFSPKEDEGIVGWRLLHPSELIESGSLAARIAADTFLNGFSKYEL